MKQSRRTTLTLATVLTLGAGLLVSAGPATAASDPGLVVSDAWNVTSPSTFPELGGGVLPAYRPAITQAPNGDLLVGFNTTTDAQPGGQLRLIRSTDEGATWSASEVLAEPTLFPGGSIHLQRGMTTLDDGTILLPYNDSVNNVTYTDREAALFVARSTDNGVTWDGTDDPIALPVPFRELWGGGGRILELQDGTLVQSVWGIRELTPDWATDPDRYEAGVLISHDGGETWPDYRQVLKDPHSPPYDAWGSLFPGGANESTIELLPDGTLQSFVRFETAVGGAVGRFYMSRSVDGGQTWSRAVTSTMVGSTLSATSSPCTAHLDGSASKLILGYRGPGSIATVSVSFDEGTTFASPVRLRDPNTGGTTSQSAEPDYQHLADGRILTVFQLQTGTAPFRLVANILEDTDDPNECQAQATAAAAAATSTPTIVVQREDRDSWFLPMSNVRAAHPATRTVAQVIAAHAQQLVCLPTDSLVLKDAGGSVLSPSSTLAQAGVEHGDTLTLSGTPGGANGFEFGYTELDIAPTDRHIANWDDACAPARMAFDYRNRSLGLKLLPPVGEVATAIELRDEDASSRLDASSYTLLTSTDNVTYTPVTGWTLVSRLESGRLIHRFEGLAVSAPYLKIAQKFSDSSFSFVLANPRNDVSVEFAP
ncbi:exo-alpha-sialidase [Microbacterium sp. NPDC028030]|uniref:exo-alpha-sialidase n=1 Tax=Microbacterium sp. NPDC028030 TaxID=3155124 RepID=UPI0033E38A1A